MVSTRRTANFKRWRTRWKLRISTRKDRWRSSTGFLISWKKKLLILKLKRHTRKYRENAIWTFCRQSLIFYLKMQTSVKVKFKVQTPIGRKMWKDMFSRVWNKWKVSTKWPLSISPKLAWTWKKWFYAKICKKLRPFRFWSISVITMYYATNCL